MRLRILLGFTALVLAGPASAQDGQAELPPVLSNRLQLNGTLELYLKQVMDQFRSAAGRDGVLKREDVASVAARQDEAARQRALAQFLDLDVNRDGTVTADEIEAARRSPASKGAVSLAEAVLTRSGGTSLTILDVYTFRAPLDPTSGLATAFDGYLALGDGKQVTAAQVIEQALATFRAVDTDGDTVTSSAELFAAEPRIAKLQALRTLDRDTFARQDCTFAPPSKEAETVLLGAYEGDALASVHVGGAHQETSTSNIVVQPGETPLYVVAVSYEPQIWAVSGAVGRIEKFIIAAPEAGERSGVVGLPKDRVDYGGAYGRPCIGHFYKSGTNETANARRAFLMATGKDADHVGGSYSLSSIALPDMTLENLAPRGRGQPVPDGFDEQTWRDALRFAPRGLVRFDPASVVSMKPAQRYEVLPQEVGLAQLVHSGQLERSGGTYRIVKPIAHFPAGLNGAHSVTFVLAKGVAMPGGSPGHSCVVFEETGEPAQPSPRCRARKNPNGAFK